MIGRLWKEGLSVRQRPLKLPVISTLRSRWGNGQAGAGPLPHLSLRRRTQRVRAPVNPATAAGARPRAPMETNAPS